MNSFAHTCSPLVPPSFIPCFLLFRPKTPGLRYEDLLNEAHPEVQEALSLAEPDVLLARTRRMKRAMDLGQKRKNLLDYAPGNIDDTFKMELYEDMEKIRARDQELAMLNAHNK